MQLIDPDHSFYRPLWIRIAIVAVCLGWAIIEASTSEPFWAIIVGALGIYSAYKLLLTYTPPPLKEETETTVAAGEPGDQEKDPE
ncbi:hypothetical protein [Rhizobium tubonense]|uniref:DUF3329 domain-containing protein n=1 Tax=Rhizobium tubonense TaxID=484088 RepID=A0A2W4EIT7_9HYPH|nr:hypothetical protein [Rhizobium tubonense]PZM13916.1 hypothetical protein CPY51_13745 [Rhizobium tubonense]